MSWRASSDTMSLSIIIQGRLRNTERHSVTATIVLAMSATDWLVITFV
jgi:hypothetical protein